MYFIPFHTEAESLEDNNIDTHENERTELPWLASYAASVVERLAVDEEHF